MRRLIHGTIFAKAKYMISVTSNLALVKGRMRVIVGAIIAATLVFSSMIITTLMLENAKESHPCYEEGFTSR